MKNSRLSTRYAKAFLELAIEQNLAERAYEDMLLVEKIAAESRELKRLLCSPIVQVDKKLDIIKEIFEPHVHSLTLSYLFLICRKKREFSIQGIAYHYCELYKASKGIITANVQSAKKLNDTVKDKLVNAIKTALKKEVLLNETVKEELIGGFIIKIKDLQYDASVASKLLNFKHELQNNDFIKTI